MIEEDGDLEEGLLDSQDWLQDSPRELSFVASLPPNDSNSFVRATSQELRSAVSSIELQNSKQGSPFAAADCVASFSSLSPRDPNHSMPLDAQSTSDARCPSPLPLPNSDKILASNHCSARTSTNRLSEEYGNVHRSKQASLLQFNFADFAEHKRSKR